MNYQTKEKIYIAIIILLIGTATQSYYSFVYAPAHDIQVYYNQDYALNTKVVNTIREADKFVYFSIYTFTRQDIAQALLAAKYRGLEVKGLTDKNQYANSTGQKKIIEDLRKAGIPVYFQDHFAIMHMKVLVTEKAYLSGSFNWTSAGTNLNDEVLEIGTAENVRKQYQNILEEVFKKYQPNTPS